MNNIWRRSFAMLLALVMVVGMLPVNAFATGDSTDPSDPSEHSCTYGDPVVVDATCTADGSKTLTCTDTTCGKTSVEVILATGHSYDEGTVTTEATCTTDGEKTFTCGTCGTTSEEKIPAGHSYDEGAVTKEATCTAEGVKTFTCGTCGTTSTEAIDATGHDFADGSCTVCGEADPDYEAPVVDEQVVAVQAMIDALPALSGEVTQSELDAFQAEAAEVQAAINALTAEQQAQLTGTEKLNPAVTVAEEAPDTVINDEDELETALTAGGDYSLGNDIDVTAEIEIPVDVTVTLDLAGHDITSGYQSGNGADSETPKHIYPINNYGTLTITDSVDNDAATDGGDGSINGRGIYNQDGAKITVNGAKIVAQDSNGGAGIWSYGTGEVYLNDAHIIGYTGVVSSEGYLEINGGTYTCYSGIADDGTQVTSPTYNIRAYNGLKITDGTFTSRHGVISLGGGTGVIEDGSYTIVFASATTSNVVYVYGDAELTIDGGNFTSDNTSGKADSGAAVLSTGNVKVTINDGTFVGMNGMVSTSANTVINGGSFDTVWDYNHYGNIESMVATDATVTVAGTEYVKTESGLEEVVTPTASGTITSCLVNLSDPAETFISSEITGLSATESVVIKLYSGETQIATTTLQKSEYYVMETLGVKIIITGESSSWKTEWAEGMPRADVIPDKVVLFVDGKEMNSANVPMISTNGEAAVNWAEVPGVTAATPAISGTFKGGHMNLEDAEEIFITTEIVDLNATESVVVKIYSGETLIATTTLLKSEYFVMDSLAVKTCLTGDSSSWSTVWEEGMPRADLAPTSGTLYVDGTEMNSANINMRDTKDATVEWATLDGVNAAPAAYVAKIGNTEYATLAEAVTAANAGDTIALYADVDSMPSINKAITIKGASEGIEVNCAIAENFPDVDGTVTFGNLTFNDRISTENASNDQSKMTLKFVGCTFNVPAGNTYAIQAGASWNNDVLGGLIVENCTFTTSATSFVKGYMIYAQCVQNVTVTGSTLDGNNVFRGAIHLGDSTEYATVATIQSNTIKNFARGVQVGNRVAGSALTIDGNTFDNVNAITGETESAALYIHEVANAETTTVTVQNNTITNSGDNTPVVFSENATGAISSFVTTFTNNTVNGTVVTAETEGVYRDTVYAPAGPFEIDLSQGSYTITAAGEYTVKGGVTTTNTLTINAEGDVTVTLNGVTIDALADNSAISIEKGNVTLISTGDTNTLNGGDNGAGIYVAADATLTIQGDKTLNANGNGGADDASGAAGIGGAYGKGASGKITIDGATVNATGYGVWASGIGSTGGYADDITIINGADVYAVGGYYANGAGTKLQSSYGKSDPEGGAAIGGGSKDGAGVGTITITNSAVEAYGGSKAAGIGAMFWNSVEKIDISGTSNVTAQGGSSSAGIGTSRAGSNGVSADIVISGGTVTATGGDYGSGIGAGYNADSLGNGADASALPKTSITISGGTVTATGGEGGAGIGGGYKSDNVHIDITGGTVTAAAGALVSGKTVENGGAPAAIGSGANGSGVFENSPAAEVDSAATIKVTAYEDGKPAIEGMTNEEVEAMENVTLTVTANPNKVYAAQIGETKYATLDEAFAAAQNGDEVKILVAGTYTLNTSGKDITITGAVDGVVFDNIGAKNMGGANVTFNNVTFDYYPNVNYTGLQHSGNMTYNGCTFNGQPFLYGTSETFNNCTFNQTSADAYNVWTYGAKNVVFNECTFNSAGKSVLIYSEQADLVNNVTVTKSTFNASAEVEGKAAIEMDSSLTSGINLTIDGEATATGFGTGNVSGNSLWNNKKGSEGANNDITVVVDGVTVLKPITGTITPGYATRVNVAGSTDIWGEATGNATQSFAVELYAGETKIATSTLNNIDGIIDGDVYVTWSIPYAGSTDEYWTVEWAEGHPNKDSQPTTIKLVVDGKAAAENMVKMNCPDDLNPINWADLEMFKPVAKVGNVEYTNIDDALAAWTNGTTLTLLADVTLPDVITLKSTEHHILDLGTYTMTAADDKNAIEIVAYGTGDAERNALTINAAATNPGGINAGNKAVIYYDYSKGQTTGNDRPIIRITGGVFTGSTSSYGTTGFYAKGTAARKCATFNISGGTFNCTILGTGKSKMLISGGTFNYSVSSQGDSTCYRLISGGTFKSFGFMTADAANKFGVGSTLSTYDKGVYVDDNGYLVVGGPVITEAGETFAASSANYSGWSSYLKYSSAAENQLYYTSAAEALADNNKTTGAVTIYTDTLDLSSLNYKGTINMPADAGTLTVTFTEGTTPAWTVATLAEGQAVAYTDSTANGVVTRTYSVMKPVAKIGEVLYETVADALAKAQNGETVELIWAEGDAPIAMNGSVSGKTVTITGTAQVDWEKGFLFVGRTNDGTDAADAKLIFSNANLTTTQGGDHGIHVSGAEKGSATKANGTVEFINSNVNLSYLINKGNMTLDNSTLTVKSGFSIGGRPASETESGEDATATITLNNGSKVVVNNHNGMGLGYEAIGVMNVDATSTFETTQSFLVTAKGTLNLAGNATIAGTLTNNGTINLTDAAATLTSTEVQNVNSTVETHKVVYEGGTYKLVEIVYVAQTMDSDGNVIGKFETFEEAVAAACADATVTRIEILSDYTQTSVENTSDYNYIAGNLTIGAPEGESYTVTVDVEGDSIALCVKAGGSLTIEENVTIEGLDVVANGFSTTGENMTINGTLKALSLKQWTSNGTITISETGTVTLGYGDGQLDLAYGNGTVTVNGTLTGTADLTDLTPQFKAGYSGTRGDSNTLNLNDTYFEAGAWFNVNGSNGTINADNSVLMVSGGDAAGKLNISSTGNNINLTNGSRLIVANITLGADNKITLDKSSSVEATTITGAGAIVIDATDMAAGDIVDVTGDLSGFTGTYEVVNNDTLEASLNDEGKIVLSEKKLIEVTYADGTVEYFTDMLEAVPYTTNYPKLEGATVKLLADINAPGIRMMENDMVLDLNGFTYTITAGTGSQGTNTSGFQIRPEVTTDATIKNGTIKVAEGAPVVWMFNVYAADFVVENVTVDCTNMDWSYGDSCYAVVSRSGDNVQFTGTTEIQNFNSEVAGHAINVGGTMTIAETVTPGGSIELDAGATLTAKAGLEVVTADGYVVVYANGVYTSVQAVAQIGETKYATLDEAFTAAQNGDEVKILVAGTYALNTSGKDITITGAVAGVVFDNIGAKNMGGASVTFNNVTFDYYPNVNYTGLQHAGNLVYNNCTINGQVFLYGASETFNNCTFNQTSADAYNVWTYGAKNVVFNECTFNSAGKSVLVYNEGACATDLTVTGSEFIASAPVEGKAAIEIDTSLMPDGTDIVINNSTAEGFAAGSVSGETLWNDKKDQTDLTVTVDDEKVWPLDPAADLTYAGYVGTSGEAGTESYRENIQVDLYNVYAKESLVVELWSGETKLSTTTLRQADRDDETAKLYPAKGSITANIVVSGRLAGSWDTEWHVAPTVENIPDTIKAYADGVLVDTWNGGFTNDTEKNEYIALTGVAKAAQIGDTMYATLASALDAANAMEGEVTITLLGDVTWETGASHGSTPLVTADSKATVTIDGQDQYTLTATGAGVGSLRAANGTVLTFQNMKIDDKSVSYAEGAWEFTYLEFGGKLVFDNVDFLSGIQVDADNGTAPETAATFTDCTFQPAAGTTSEYSVWLGNGTASFTNCEFTGTRGLKIHEDYGSEVASVTVDGCTFELTAKPGIVIGDLNADTTVEVKSSTFTGNYAGDQNLYAIESDTAYDAFTLKFNANNTVTHNNFVAQVGEYLYPTIQSAVNAVEAGNTVTVIADVADEAVTVGKSVTITGEKTLNNVSITGNGTEVELTVSGLTFTGNSWINSGDIKALTVSGVTANVTPSNTSATNSRSAFIALGRVEQNELKLTVEDSKFIVSGGGDPILGWAAITEATITGNTFGSESAYITNADAAKFMAIADGAIFTVTGNTVYSNYNGFVFGQNTTRDNAYTVIVEDNEFYGSADHIWVEVSGAATTHATVKATSDNTVNGNALTALNLKTNVTTWTSYAGVDVETDETGKLTGGIFTELSNKDCIAEGYYAIDNEDGTWTIGVAVAQNITTEKIYGNVADALAEAQSGDTVILLQDATDGYVLVTPGRTLDLNGFELTADYVVGFNSSNVVDNSEGNTGLLKVASSDNVALAATNSQLPVWNGKGYIFTTVSYKTRKTEETTDQFKFNFLPVFQPYATTLLQDGVEGNKVTIVARISWETDQGRAYENFVYNEKQVSSVVGKTNMALTLLFTGIEELDATQTLKDNIIMEAVVISETGVEIASEPLTFTVN